MIENIISYLIAALLTSKYFLYALAVTLVLWVLYVSIMTLNRRRKQLITGIAYYTLLPVGVIIDVVYNWTLASLIFWDWPAEPTLSQRLTRYIRGKAGRRRSAAMWICLHLIEPWDQNHCKLNQYVR